MKILLLGYGKMGKAIESIALQRGHQIAYKIDTAQPHLLASIPAQGVDMAFEFTQPKAAYDNIRQCITQHIPVVAGTTGWLQHQPALEAYCRAQKGTFFYASNFSIGVNIFFKLNAWLARIMNAYPGYTPQLEEIHHTTKQDAPSGTAITLAATMIEHIDRTKAWRNDTVQQDEVVNIISKRENNVPGTHKVTYTSATDTLQMIHTAHNRTGFALGAVLVAEWLQGQQGIFSMDDFLTI